MMLVPALVVQPRVTHSGVLATNADRRAMAVIVFDTFKKLGRGKLGQVVYYTAPYKPYLAAMQKNGVSVTHNQPDMAEKVSYTHFTPLVA